MTPAARASLDRESVVRAALALLDEVGLEKLTLRALAARLGVQAPAIYWYVDSKAALLDQMATTMLRDLLAQGAAPPGDWRVMMSVSAQGLRRMMLSRRDGARVFAGTYLTDDSLVASSEGPMSVLTAAGFPLREAVLAWQAVYCYVVGFCIEEQGMLAATGGRDTRYDAGARQKRLDPARAR